MLQYFMLIIISENLFLEEILSVPVSDLFLAVLSNYIPLIDIQCFVALTPSEEKYVNQIKIDVYKT